MSQPNQPQDLEKRSRELAEKEKVLNAREDLVARENAINKRQKIFDETEAKLEVLKKQIKAKDDILAARTIDFDTFVVASNEKIASLKAQEETVLKFIKLKQDSLIEVKNQETTLNNSIRLRKTELNEVKSQIKESNDYRDEQGRIVENTIAEWNSILVEFRKEADLIQEEKNKLSKDIIRLEQDKTTLVIEVDKEEAKLEALYDSYEQKVEQYKASLRALDTEVSQKRNELDSVINATNMRLKEVETREKSIKLKEGNINRIASELDQKERRLKMNYGIADIAWEDGV